MYLPTIYPLTCHPPTFLSLSAAYLHTTLPAIWKWQTFGVGSIPAPLLTTYPPHQLCFIEDMEDFDADDAIRDEDDVAGLGRLAQLGVRDADLRLARLRVCKWVEIKAAPPPSSQGFLQIPRLKHQQLRLNRMHRQHTKT